MRIDEWSEGQFAHDSVLAVPMDDDRGLTP